MLKEANLLSCYKVGENFLMNVNFKLYSTEKGKFSIFWSFHLSLNKRVFTQQ